MLYMLTSFKVCGYSLFSNEVELNLAPIVRNNQHLTDNIVSKDGIKKVLKSSVVYGGNNSGKSSILEAIMTMKKIFEEGSLEHFDFDRYKNFFKQCDKISFTISFTTNDVEIDYSIFFTDNNNVGETIINNGDVYLSRDLDGKFSGTIFVDESFKTYSDIISEKKLIVPFITEYTKESQNTYLAFDYIKKMFSRIKFIDNSSNRFHIQDFIDFNNDPNKMQILNRLIATTSLFMEKRDVITKDELLTNEYFLNQKMKKSNNRTNEIDLNTEIDINRVMSIYKNDSGNNIMRPSRLFDSLGTNKFLYLAITIINAIINNEILLIDELDSSIHYKLTRALVILMNSQANNRSQFIFSTHDVKLLSHKLLRKDQINFSVRDNNHVEIIRLDNYKSNSDIDIRSTSNFEKMYLGGEIVDLPETNIYEVIIAIKDYLFDSE